MDQFAKGWAYQQPKLAAAMVRHSLGCRGAAALEGVAPPSDFLGVDRAAAVGARGVDAAIVRLVGVGQEVGTVRRLRKGLSVGRLRQRQHRNGGRGD